MKKFSVNHFPKHAFCSLSLLSVSALSQLSLSAAPNLNSTRRLMRSVSSWLRAARWDSSSNRSSWLRAARGVAGFVGLWWWVCGFFYGGLRWIYGGFALAVGFWFFFFFILCCSKHCKMFFRLFSGMQPNTGKKIIFLEIIYICKHFMVKNDLQRNKQSLSEKDEFHLSGI